MPVLTLAGSPASSACSIGVSAPSSRTSAQANGRSRGWPGSGSAIQAQETTSPVGPTGTHSSSGSAVTGSCSCGGTSTRPSRARMPSTRPSRRPDRKRPRTGPTDRW